MDIGLADADTIDVMGAKEWIEVHALDVSGTFSSRQRMTSHLVTRGSVAVMVSSSVLQTVKTQIYISEERVAPFNAGRR